MPDPPYSRTNAGRIIAHFAGVDKAIRIQKMINNPEYAYQVRSATTAFLNDSGLDIPQHAREWYTGYRAEAVGALIYVSRKKDAESEGQRNRDACGSADAHLEETRGLQSAERRTSSSASKRFQ